MRYVTLDFEYADRVLPGICSITAIKWDDGKIIDEFHTLLNPECEVEEFFFDRHGLSNSILDKEPLIEEIWITLFKFISNEMVFMHNANDRVVALQQRANYGHLLMPDFSYGDTQSIARRTWKGLNSYNLESVKDHLGIIRSKYDSFEDARSIGDILKEAIIDNEVSNHKELFDKIGFAGGFMYNQEKLSYRAVKEDGVYVAKITLPKEEKTIFDNINTVRIE